VMATSACAIATQAGDPEAGVPRINGACAPEFPDCQDTLVIDQDDPTPDDLFPDGEPRDGATPPGPTGVLVGGGLTVPEALATDAGGFIAVQGFYFDDGAGPRLCESLAESLPPLCGGAHLLLGDMGELDLGAVQSSQGTTWTDDLIVIYGELADGVLTPTPTSI
jgi:hypothetical protein